MPKPMSFWPLSDYDLQKTCRSCLRVSDELIPLDSYPKQLPDDESDMNRSMTTGELMMACANIKVRALVIIFKYSGMHAMGRGP